VLEGAHGLHAAQIVHNGQAVEPQTAVLEVVDILNAERVWSAMRNLVYRVALVRDVAVRPKQRPDSTHVA